MLKIGQKVWIKSSPKRYHAGVGEICEIDPTPNANQKYLIERTKEDGFGKGLRRFWASRGEFDMLNLPPHS